MKPRAWEIWFGVAVKIFTVVLALIVAYAAYGKVPFFIYLSLVAFGLFWVAVAFSRDAPDD